MCTFARGQEPSLPKPCHSPASLHLPTLLPSLLPFQGSFGLPWEVWGRGAVSRWVFSQHCSAPGKPCSNLSQSPPPIPPPTWAGTDLSQQASQLWSIQGKQPRRLQAPSSQEAPAQPGSHGGGGCSLAQGLWGWGGAGESRKGRHYSQSHSFLHPLTSLPTDVQSTNI